MECADWLLAGYFNPVGMMTGSSGSFWTRDKTDLVLDGVSIGNQGVQQKLWSSDNLLSIVWQFTSLFKDVIGLY